MLLKSIAIVATRPTWKSHINPFVELYLTPTTESLTCTPSPAFRNIGKKCPDAARIFSQQAHDFAVVIYGHLRASQRNDCKLSPTTENRAQTLENTVFSDSASQRISR
jgi:hypothetical protein